MTLNASLAIAHKAIKHWDCIVGSPVFVMQRENTVFKIETKFGFAALRIHRQGYHSLTEIESELQWMAHLVQAGLKVPKPFHTRHGTIVAEIKDDHQQAYIVDLLSWLGGEPLGKSKIPLAHSKENLIAIFFELGCSLAHMHNASDQWSLPNGFQRHALNKEGLIGETAAWGRFWDASCLSLEEKFLMSKARSLAVVKIDALTEAGADYGLIHADLVRENILIFNGQTRFIDFDDAGFGFRIFDLATALVKNRDEPHYEAMKSRLFEGYKSVRSLSSLDENSLDLFLSLRDFAYLGWADARREEPTIAPRFMQIKRETLFAAKAFLDRS